MIACNRCRETRHTWSLWKGFAHAPDADVICCIDTALGQEV